MIFPIVFLRLQPHIGFPWTVRILGFIQLACTLVALPVLFSQPAPKPGPPRSLVHWYAFKQLPFTSYFVSGFLVFMAYLIPVVYIPNYGVSVLGETHSIAYYQLAASNAASLFGRLGAAAVSQKLGAPNVLMFSILSSAVIIFSWICVTTSAGFWVWCVFWGFCSGILISINPVVIAHPVISEGPNVIGTRLGMQWFPTGVGFLIGSPIAGSLLSGVVNTRTAFVHLQIFAGAIMTGGGAFLVLPLLAIFRHDAKAKARS